MARAQGIGDRFVAERLEQAGETYVWRVGGVDDNVAVEILHRALWRDLRLDLGVAVKSGEAGAGAGFVVQNVRGAVLNTKWAVLRAVDDDSFEVGDRLVAVARHHHGLR